jgi:hypothetical protein
MSEQRAKPVARSGAKLPPELLPEMRDRLAAVVPVAREYLRYRYDAEAVRVMYMQGLV